MGFFSASTLAKAQGTRQSSIPKCGACRLYTQCQSPKISPLGTGKILIVANEITNDEDRLGPAVGASYRHLKEAIQRGGLSFSHDVTFTHATICNGGTEAEHVDYCRPHLNTLIRDLNPEVIIPMGTLGARAVLAPLWKENPGGIELWNGYLIPSQDLNAWVCPVWSPSYVRHEMDKKPVANLLWQQHIQRALSLEGTRPFKKAPDYHKSLVLETNTDHAAKLIRDIVRAGGETAFDYECNMLKPEGPDAQLVTASIASKALKLSVAFPFKGAAKNAMRKYLRSPLPKIASNMKFEERWSRRILKTRVRNWTWDTMLSAHAISNRRATKSVKFQSFVLLGFAPYNQHIEECLKADEPHLPNRIHEIELTDLLEYNALDSLLELLVADKQRKIVGVK